MMQMLQTLTQRERTLVSLALAGVILAATFQFIWLPVQAKRAALSTEIAGYAQVMDRIAAMGPDTPILQPATGAIPPLSTRVTQSADVAGLVLRRLEPEGDMLRVTVDDVAFANVILWLSDLETTHAVIVAGIEVDRRPAPGIVSARLLLRGNP